MDLYISLSDLEIALQANDHIAKTTAAETATFEP